WHCAANSRAPYSAPGPLSTRARSTEGSRRIAGKDGNLEGTIRGQLAIAKRLGISGTPLKCLSLSELSAWRRASTSIHQNYNGKHPMPMHTSTTQALVRPNFALTERKPQPQSRGRRRIKAFYLPGDVFGLEVDDEHHFSVEAVTDSTILVVKRSALMSLANADGDVARRLGPLPRVNCGACRTTCCCSPRPRKSAWPRSCSIWPSSWPPSRRSRCPCRARTSRIISVSPSR